MAVADSPGSGPRTPRWERVALYVALLPPVLFLLSTLPGVRPERGYDLLLDGLLNNLAYAMAPVICLLRVRRVTGRRTGGYLLATALALFPADLSQPPRSWAERTYNITRYTRMPRGGHFAAHEEPELLAHDLTEFFRAHRLGR